MTVRGQWPSITALGVGCLLCAAGPDRTAAQEAALLAGFAGSLVLLDPETAAPSAEAPIVEARLTPQGYPEPSIILGAITPQRRGLFGLPPESGLPGDPPQGTNLAVLLQTMLQEMGCYRMAIDGAWGPGSAGAARTYFATLGRSAPTGVSLSEPSVELFRALRDGGLVRCPEPPRPTTARPAPVAQRQVEAAPPVAPPAPVEAAPQASAPPQETTPGEVPRGFGGPSGSIIR